MNNTHLFRALCCSVLAAGLSCVALAAEATPSLPKLILDPSPLAENARPGMVMSYADVVGPVQKAVVSVHSTKVVRSEVQMHPMLRQFFGDSVPEKESKQQGLGSGVIVTTDGYIITNNHVVDGASELKVALDDGREFVAKLIGADPKTDVAVIKIESEQLPLVPLADSDKLRVGDVVFALGNPLGVGQTVTMGIVSAVGRSNLGLLNEQGGGVGYESFIQTDAAINMGNSGGALVDAKGRLVGINTAIISPSRGNIGIGFAIPVNLAASTMQNLVANKGIVQRGRLGVSGGNIQDEEGLAESLGLPKDQKGVFVEEISPDGPAVKAGIVRGDLIVGLNGKPVTSIVDLRLMVAQMAPGTTVKVSLLRSGKPLTVEATLAAMQVVADAELLPGVTVAVITPELRKQLDIDRNVQGLAVQEIDEKSPFVGRLAPGVVIMEINGQPVSSLEQARGLLVKGKYNRLYVYFRGVSRSIAVLY